MNMTIGFGTGVFYRILADPLDRFLEEYVRLYKTGGTNAFELLCRDEGMLDFLLADTSMDLSPFSWISLHMPDTLVYKDDEPTHRMLSKLERLTRKFGLKNFVFHADIVQDWRVLDRYAHLPLSIENMDERKLSGRTVQDIASILDKHDFKLTLDLQHCFVNDRSMQLARDFQEVFKDRIVEYHVSGYEERFLHYPLYKTNQPEILEALKYKETPIIIESTFDEIGEQEKELAYIISRS
jgi:hypothetical protein